LELAMTGLGRMGANMVRRLLRGRHEVVVYDRTPAAAEAVVREGATAAASLQDLVARLARPRAAWVMVPAGGPTEETIAQLAALIRREGPVGAAQAIRRSHRAPHRRLSGKWRPPAPPI